MTKNYALPHLAGITPYTPGKPVEELERELGIEHAVKLASNETPLGPSPKAVAAMGDVAAGVHRYPDNDAFTLRARLAELHDIAPEELCFGHGSNVLVDLICRTFADSDRHAIIGTPSFSAYALSLAVSAVPTSVVPLVHGLFWSADDLLAAVRPSTALLFLDNPNNPTSTYMKRDELAKLLQELPDPVLPIVDEAYIHFVDAPDYESALELRALCPRLIVLRTFSKAFGLAGARAGYAIGPAALIAEIEKVRAPFSLNAFAQAGALAALEDRAHLARVVDHNRAERSRVAAKLSALGLDVAPSQTNFLFAKLPQDRGLNAHQAHERLLRDGVIVRALAEAPAHLRITLGLCDENDRLIEALRAVLS